jgi:hypothetical protein
VLISSQNHGFAVDESTLPDNLRPTHRSLFDGSLQGVARTDRPAFSFQGHPEASPGPHDLKLLFEHFMYLMVKRIQSNSRGRTAVRSKPAKEGKGADGKVVEGKGAEIKPAEARMADSPGAASRAADGATAAASKPADEKAADGGPKTAEGAG